MSLHFTRLVLLFVLWTAFSIVTGGSARAETTGAPARAVFALVVGNNRSRELDRPDLRYADDDAVKYYEFFRMLAPDGFEFVVGNGAKRTLVVRDAQHEYLFTET